MFDEFAQKLKDLQADVPKIFEKVAKKGAKKFVNEAQNRTDKEGLVDTGAYKRSWASQVFEMLPEGYGVECTNNMEYASFLEYGHKTRGNTKVKGRFVGELAMGDARFYCLEELHKEIEKALEQK